MNKPNNSLNNSSLKKFFHIYFYLNQSKKESFSLLPKKSQDLLNLPHNNDMLLFSKHYSDAKKICVQAIFYYGLPGYILYLNIVMQGLDKLHNTFEEIVQCEARKIYEIFLISQFFCKKSNVMTELLKSYPDCAMLNFNWKNMQKEIINNLELNIDDIAETQSQVFLLLDKYLN
jgi:hypothetical protein